MTDIRTIIAELRELEKMATDAPWVKSSVHPCILEEHTTLYTMCMRDSGTNADANAYFVLASRNALPILLDYIAKLDELSEAVAWTIEHWDMMRDPKYRGDTRWELCEGAAFSHRELSRLSGELDS